MDKAFWLDRWENQKIGFHQDEINPYLIKHWPSIEPASGSRVFVPLCGKSMDLLWLAEQGYEVTGVEFSQAAVEAFFQEHSLTYQMTTNAKLNVYQSGNITLYQGDFFDLRAADLGPVSVVFDRASLIALPATMRAAYCQQLSALAPAASLLLVCMEYDQDAMQGPPFSVTESEVNQYFAKFYRINVLQEADLLSSSPQFSARGLQSMNEKVYQISPLT